MAGMNDPTGGAEEEEEVSLSELLRAMAIPAENKKLAAQALAKRKLLEEQIGQLTQQQPSPHWKGMGALYQGIGDVLGGVIGGVRARGARNEIAENERATAAQLTKNAAEEQRIRAAYGNQVLRGMAPSYGSQGSPLGAGAGGLPQGGDPGGMFEDDPRMMQMALTRALAGKRAGAMGMLSGDPTMAKLGQAQFQDASKQAEEYGPGARLKRAGDAQALAKAKAEYEFANAPANSAYQAFARKFGVQLPEGATNAQAHQILQMGQNAWATQQRHWRQNRPDKPKGEGDGKRIMPAEQAALIGQFDAAENTLADLSKSWDTKLDWTSGVGQFVPGTDSKEYTDELRQAAQTIGVVLEKGKMTDADVPRYMDMLPQAGDSLARKTNKAESLKRKLRNARDSQLGGLGAAGYDVSGFNTRAAGPAPSATGPKIRRTDPATKETRVWDGKNWVKE